MNLQKLFNNCYLSRNKKEKTLLRFCLFILKHQVNYLHYLWVVFPGKVKQFWVSRKS